VSGKDYGGQRHNMEDDTMVDTLRAQASIIWPLERALLKRHVTGAIGRVLDIACGTGEILRRVKRDFRPSFVTGVDLFHGHLQRAPKPVAKGDGYRLPFGSDLFDLALARHVTQALEDPVRFLREALRVLRPGGRIHTVAEDYAGLFFDTEDYATARRFVRAAPTSTRAGARIAICWRRALPTCASIRSLSIRKTPIATRSHRF